MESINIYQNLLDNLSKTILLKKIFASFRCYCYECVNGEEYPRSISQSDTIYNNDKYEWNGCVCRECMNYNDKFILRPYTIMYDEELEHLYNKYKELEEKYTNDFNMLRKLTRPILKDNKKITGTLYFEYANNSFKEIRISSLKDTRFTTEEYYTRGMENGVLATKNRKIRVDCDCSSGDIIYPKEFEQFDTSKPWKNANGDWLGTVIDRDSGIVFEFFGQCILYIFGYSLNNGGTITFYRLCSNIYRFIIKPSINKHVHRPNV